MSRILIPLSAPPDYQAIIAAPCFALGLRCSDNAIFGLDFLPPTSTQTPAHALGKRAVRQLQNWLEDADFQFDLPLSPPNATPFRQRVWQRIRAIPAGQTSSYGQLAAALASSPRAVGAACAANPLPIFVPCHRVIAQNGRLCGFNHAKTGWLLEVKRWLIEREQKITQT